MIRRGGQLSDERRRATWPAVALFLFALICIMADDQVVETVHVPQLVAPIQGALAPSPYSFEFTDDFKLRLFVANTKSGCSVTVAWRFLDRAGRIQTNQRDCPPTSDGFVNSFEFGAGDGYLLNVTIYASAGTPKRGQTYTILNAIFGGGTNATTLGTLAAGYVTALQPRAWPGSPIEGSLEGDGYERVVIGTDPAANVEWAETVPAGRRWELRTVRAQLVTSAAAGTRTPRLVLDDGAVDLMIIPTALTIAVSDANTFQWMQGVQQDTLFDADIGIAALPVRTLLQGGHRVRSSTGNFQLGDDWGAPRLTLREWLEV